MSTVNVNARVKLKIDTADDWTTNNPTLLDGEMGVESDTHYFKVGDGSTAWNSLPYATIPMTVGLYYQVLDDSTGQYGSDNPCVG